MADHFQTIYATRAAEYDLLIRREDLQGNLLRAITAIRPADGLDIVEMGAGTGRLTRLLAPLAKTIRAYDASAHMLEVAASSLAAMGATNAKVAVGDNRQLPVEDAAADLVIEGWSFGHATGWYPDTWRDEVDKMLGEMMRVLRPGGTAILIETLGTGHETPFIPSNGLAALYAWWQWEKGFTGTWIRTDLDYESVEEAARMQGFFFGEEHGERVRQQKLTHIPECTGIWWRTK